MRHKRTILALAFLVMILVALCWNSPVHAQTRMIMPQRYVSMQQYVPMREPSVSIVRFQNRTSIFPSVVACHTLINCLTISNRTGRTITLYLNGGWYLSMWAGETISPTLTWGRNVFTIAGVHRFVALVVVAQPPMRYDWGWQPMQRAW